MANYYVIRIKFHWGFSYVTLYMKHSLLGTRTVILSMITHNFFMIQNKIPMKSELIECVLVETTIGATPCAFHDNSPQLQEICFCGFLPQV